MKTVMMEAVVKEVAMEAERMSSLNYWDERHSLYRRDKIKTDEWLDEFHTIIEKCTTPILDIGCGGGNDTLFFIQKGKKVISCDQSPNAIANIMNNFPEVQETRCFNFLDGFDFDDNSFEIICADLCLHYFRMDDTQNILRELKRILVPGGHIFVRVNSVRDVLHGAGQGEEVEKHLYKTEEGMIKRFFDKEDIESIFSAFDIGFCEEQIMTRYSSEKIVYSVCLSK